MVYGCRPDFMENVLDLLTQLDSSHDKKDISSKTSETPPGQRENLQKDLPNLHLTGTSETQKIDAL